MSDPWLEVVRAVLPLPPEERVRCLGAALRWAESVRRDELREQEAAAAIVAEVIERMRNEQPAAADGPPT